MNCIDTDLGWAGWWKVSGRLRALIVCEALDGRKGLYVGGRRNGNGRSPGFVWLGSRVQDHVHRQCATGKFDPSGLGFPVHPHSNLKLPPERSKPANEWALIRSRVNIEINLPDERCDLKRQEGWPYKDRLSLK